MTADVICIDGPSGVGKTAVARALAHQLGWRWLSVGAVYRALAAADASLDATLRLVTRPAADGGLDPVIQVDGHTVTEEELLGADLGRKAAAIAHIPEWQRKVNAELGRYAGRGLVAEGRATQRIFPSAALHVYLWADQAERSRRAAAVTGAPHDAERDRRDASRATEALQVRPGAVVWNSTRYAMDETVAGLVRRFRLAADAERVVVGVEGDPSPAGDGQPFRLVNAAVAGEQADAVVRIPPGVAPGCRDELVAAHLPILLAGNDLVSIGGVLAGDTATGTQRMLEAAPWPLQRYVRADWLRRHGHFAVSRDVLGLVAGSVSEARLLAGRLASGADLPPPLLDALQGCRWVPNPAALARCPAGAGGPVARRLHLDELLSSVAGHVAAAEACPVDLRDSPDNRAGLWVLAAAPHRDLDVTLAWDGAGPECAR